MVKYVGSIVQGIKTGSNIHNYMTEIRKQNLELGSHIEGFEGLEKRLNGLSGGGRRVAVGTAMIRDLIGGLCNSQYVFYGNFDKSLHQQ